MLIQQNFVDETNTEMTYTYSDKGYYIRSLSDGYLYDEAYDPTECNRQYEETDMPIEQPEEDEEGEYPN